MKLIDQFTYMSEEDLLKQLELQLKAWFILRGIAPNKITITRIGNGLPIKYTVEFS